MLGWLIVSMLRYRRWWLKTNRNVPLLVSLNVPVSAKVRRGRVVEDKRSRHCPYLDTINRWDVCQVKASQKALSPLTACRLTACLSSGASWISTLRNFAPSRSPTSTSMLAWYVGNTFKVGGLFWGSSPALTGKINLMVFLLVFCLCRSRSQVPCLHPQCPVHPPCVSESAYSEVLLSAGQLWDYWFFFRRHHSKWQTQNFLTFYKCNNCLGKTSPLMPWSIP